MSGRNPIEGSFSASSEGMELIDGHILRARCRNEHGHLNTSDLDLNSCIGNLNGYLAWDYRDFQHSSNDIKLADNGTKLEARLRKQDGQYSAPQGIYLNERIVNRNGHLAFVDHNQTR